MIPTVKELWTREVSSVVQYNLRRTYNLETEGEEGDKIPERTNVFQMDLLGTIRRVKF